MDDALFVRVREGARDLSRDVDGELAGNALALAETGRDKAADAAPVQELLRDDQLSVDLVDGEL